MCRLATSKSLGAPGLLDEVKLVLGQAKFNVVRDEGKFQGFAVEDGHSGP